jgi:Protein of unknown function (DUF4232)
MTSSRRRARRTLAAAALCCIAAFTVACGSSASPAAAPTKTVTVTPSAPASTSSASPGAVSSPASPPAVAACATRDLRAKVGVGQGAAGSTYIALVFTNIGSSTCTLFGYPGVSLAGGQPVHRIGKAAAESNTNARQLVMLAPGAVANALLRIANAANYPPAKCGPVPTTFLQIYPPNQTTPIYLGYKSTACSKPLRLLTIGVERPGTGSAS